MNFSVDNDLKLFVQRFFELNDGLMEKSSGGLELLLPEELERKKADLYKKYSIRAGLELCGAIQIRTPAVKLLFEASIGRKQKQLSMMYNPVSKSMDPLVCDGCGGSTFHIRFCTNLHLLCPACATNCPVC